MIAAVKSAGGAPIGQLIVLASVYWLGSGGLVWLVHRHRAGKTQILARASARAEWFFRMPGWAALPVAVAVVSLLCLMFGGYWDIGYHIDKGRDSGPLGNPGHWPMLAGFFGSFAAGVLALGLAEQKDATPSWVPIRRGWSVPVGAILMTSCSVFGLAALPLDDVWHRIFGQDVTLWSPTHFLLLGGATMTVIGMIVLTGEARRASARRGVKAGVGIRLWGKVQRFALLGGMLGAFEAFLAEYDWGVPLYRQVWQPLLLAVFAAIVFVSARSAVGPGGALGAWATYLVVRIVATLMPVLAGRSPSLLPLLLFEAVAVEAVALKLHPRNRPLAFGALAGAACGAACFASEYAWSQVAMPLPWTPALIPEGVPSAIGGGVAGGILGTLLAMALRRELPSRAVARTATLGALALLIALGVNAGIKTVPDAFATITVDDATPAPKRTANMTIRLDPPTAADDANWFYVLGWQGGANRIVDRLERVSEGVYRTTEPIPLHGTWKIGLRLQKGRERGAVPIRLPADAGIAKTDFVLPTSFDSVGEMTRLTRGPGAGAALPAPAATFRRPFAQDGMIVLREQKTDVPGSLWAVSIAGILTLYLLLFVSLALGLARMTRRDGRPTETERRAAAA